MKTLDKLISEMIGIAEDAKELTPMDKGECKLVAEAWATEVVKNLHLQNVTARTFNVGEKATWRGMELFVAEVGNNEVLLATDMNVDAEDYNDWWVTNVYAL